MPIPEPDQQDVEWAYRLWGAMADGGRWSLPGVGVYVRVGDSTLTLIEIHAAKPNNDAFGNSLFDKHEWIQALGDAIGWTIDENVLIAFDREDVQVNIPDDMIGVVAICGDGCGAVVRVVPLSAGVSYAEIEENGSCPVCGVPEAIQQDLRGVHCVVDDTSVYLKQQAELLKEEAKHREEVSEVMTEEE